MLRRMIVVVTVFIMVVGGAAFAAGGAEAKPIPTLKVDPTTTVTTCKLCPGKAPIGQVQFVVRAEILAVSNWGKPTAKLYKKNPGNSNWRLEVPGGVRFTDQLASNLYKFTTTVKLEAGQTYAIGFSIPKDTWVSGGTKDFTTKSAKPVYRETVTIVKHPAIN